MPASRPRVSKWGTYYGKRHQAFQKEAFAQLDTMREASILLSDLFSGRLMVWVRYRVEKPRTSKLDIPRGDIDNYNKLFYDCCTGYVWKDDCQIEREYTCKEFTTGTGQIDLWVIERNGNETVESIYERAASMLSDTCDITEFTESGFYGCPRCYKKLNRSSH